jgi:glutathione synthase/RimK-type ligase-like ATP-grasp enzyme
MDQLKILFSNDLIIKPEEYSGGADIAHLVKDGDKEVASILYEIKNKTS